MIIIIFFLGLIIGSFLNVCIYRLPKKESILFPWSYCPNCGHTLSYYDKIPILSFIFLKGKCRFCNKKISYRYPLIELLTGFLFFYTAYSFEVSIDFFLNIILISTLVIITFIDFDYKLIPDIITIPFIIFFLLANFLRYLFFHDFDLLHNSLVGFLIGCGTIYLIAWISNGGMGGGDIKLAGLLGSAVGFKKIILTLFLSFIIGGIFGIILIITGKKTRKDIIPFGPFLCIAGIISIFWGQDIIYWYLVTGTK